MTRRRPKSPPKSPAPTDASLASGVGASANDASQAPTVRSVAGPSAGTQPAPPRAPTERRSALRTWLRLPVLWCLVAIVIAGLFAPLFANDVPLVARVAGRWQFPAFADLVGSAPVGPDDLSWKQWWSRLPSDGSDFAWMPPWPHGPRETDRERFGKGPSLAHPFGSDDTGRDCFARILHGAHTVVTLALPSIALAAFAGTLLGAWAALRRGWADIVVLRLIEIVMCFPTLLFVLFVSSSFGNQRLGLVIVLATLFWTKFARIVRGELLSLRERDFVHVARGLGLGERQILQRHLLPLTFTKIAVTAAFCMASAVVAESTLSFLGLGPGDGSTSWGAMLRQGSEQAVTGAWHLWFFPAAAIVTVVICCHLLADRLRDASAFR
jgi:peptide/nickel transport system permease protein